MKLDCMTIFLCSSNQTVLVLLKWLRLWCMFSQRQQLTKLSSKMTLACNNYLKDFFLISFPFIAATTIDKTASGSWSLLTTTLTSPLSLLSLLKGREVRDQIASPLGAYQWVYTRSTSPGFLVVLRCLMVAQCPVLLYTSNRCVCLH